MSIRDSLKPVISEAIDKARLGEKVRIQSNGPVHTLKIYAYGIRKELEASDIKISAGHDYIEISTKGAFQASANVGTSSSKPGAPVSSGASPLNQLLTSVPPSEEIFALVHSLLELKVVQTVEFLGTTEEQFKAVEGHEGFMGRSTNRGYVVV